MRLTLWEPRGDLDPGLVQNVLLLVTVNVPLDVAQRWTVNELRMAYDWAMREHLHASDNPVRRRDKPWFITAAEGIQATRELAGSHAR